MINERRASDGEEPAPIVFGDGGAGIGQTPLFIALVLISGGLLLAVESQTQTPREGGGWWNGPALAPTVALLVTFGSAILGGISTWKHGWARPGSIRPWPRAFALATAFVLALGSIAYVGYGIATLLLATAVSLLAGYRGTKLAVISVCVTIVMILFFRVILGVWFPEAEIFKLVPLLQPLARYL